MYGSIIASDQLIDSKIKLTDLLDYSATGFWANSGTNSNIKIKFN